MRAPDRSRLLEKVRRLPHGPGVYLMKDRLGTIIYVGKAKDLHRRVSSYFQPSRRRAQAQPKIAAMVDLVADLEALEVRHEAEALLLEGRLIKEWRPKYNTDFTDDKRFLLVRLEEREALPRFRLCRLRTDEQARYFGPFAHSGLLRRTLAEMRRRFGILLGDARPQRLADGNWQLYDDVRAEIYGHPNVVSAESYRERVEQACTFLEGKSRELLEELQASMAEAAARQEYERAAQLRDLLQALQETLRPARKFTRAPDTVSGGADALAALGAALGLAAPPRTIECFDISHISGTFCVASLVRFQRGAPDKAGYRRFRIRTFAGNDDFRAMAEVVGRRYRRLHEEGQPFPDLVVIDGGQGQVGAAAAAFALEGLTPPALIGLAKREETIIFPGERAPLQLPLEHPGLRLLQRVRDEAHRFANTYNADLRSRRLRETILDEFPGLGPVRKRALLEHFGTLEGLRRADPAALAAVAGFGPVLAARLHSFLHPPEPAVAEDPPEPPGRAPAGSGGE